MVKCMNKTTLFIVLTSLIITLHSCKSKKGILPSTPQKANEIELPTGKMMLLKTIELQKNTLNFYSATGDLNFKDENQKQELGVTIVMEKDKYILFNVTAIMGIAVARVLATPDSLVILDLLHRKAIITNYDYIIKITRADLQLGNLQNLLIGNTLFPNIESTCSVDSTPNSIQVLQQLTSSIVQKTIYTPNLKIAQSIINESSKSQEMIVSYEQVHAEGNNLIPSNFNVTINTSKKMYVSFDLKNFVFEKKKDLQFSIPKSYERVRL